MKKVMSLVLCALLLALCLPAASPAEESGYDYAKVTWFFNESQIAIQPDSYLVKKIAEDLNIDFVHISPIGSEYEAILMQQIASGEVPDIIDTYSTLTNQLKAEGLIQPVGEYLTDEYLPNLIRVSNNWDAAIKQITFPDGQVWTIPSCYSNTLSGTAPFIRKDWLDKLGLEVPTTLDELAEVLIAFANGDPNGDGSQVYGTMYNEYWGLNFLNKSFAATTNYWFWAEDGLPELGVLSPRIKDVLVYAKHLLDNGAFNKDIVTMKYDTIMEKVRAGLVGYLDGWTGLTDQDDMQAIYPDAEWIPILPVKGVFDKGYNEVKDNTDLCRNQYAISATTKDIDAVLRLMNYFADDQSTEAGMTFEGPYWEICTGERGVNWDVINGMLESGNGASGDAAAAAKFKAANEGTAFWVGRRFVSKFDTRWMGTTQRERDLKAFLLSIPTGDDIPDDNPLKGIAIKGSIDDALYAQFESKWPYDKYGEMLVYNAIFGKGDIDRLYEDFLAAANADGYQEVRQIVAEYLKANP